MIRLDATIVVAHSDKQQARGTFKGTWGHHPLTAWCDNTDESLAVMPRPGNAGSNTAADHITVVDAAVAQIPAKYRRRMLFTCDGAGSTHALVEHVTKLGHGLHHGAGDLLRPELGGSRLQNPGRTARAVSRSSVSSAIASVRLPG